MPKIDGQYCPFYEWDANSCNPGKSNQNPTGSVGVHYKPYCQGDNDWKRCDIYQNARQMQKRISAMMGVDYKPKWD